MKKLAITLLLLANASFATTMISGAQTLHALKCSSKIIPFVPVQVSLNIITQALAPQYSVRAITLNIKTMVPNAKTSTTALKQDNQNAYFATFTAENVKVSLDKSTFKATLIDGDIEYSCK